MIKFLKHFTAQPFIAATGAAALVHSTWALAVLFTGEPPHWDPTSFASWARWIYWLVPALLIAFALDVGQIATSTEIRAGERTTSKYITFIVFALATYYLQWLYIAHHMPALELGAGVYQEGLAARVVLLTRNAAIWFIPALLPLSTTMYTLSGNVKEQPHTITAQKPIETVLIAETSKALAAHVTEQSEETAPTDGGGHIAVCASCGWEGNRTYDSETSVARALAAHRRTCPALKPELYSNGHAHEEMEF